MSELDRIIPQPPGKKEAPEDTERWSRWAKENPEQAAVMIKDWIGTVEGG